MYSDYKNELISACFLQIQFRLTEILEYCGAHDYGIRPGELRHLQKLMRADSTFKEITTKG